MVDVIAAVAVNEVREISKRTKKALAEKKKDGALLGSKRPDAPVLTVEARAKGGLFAAAAITALRRAHNPSW